jgi:SAM-dependent methyltransferase
MALKKKAASRGRSGTLATWWKLFGLARSVDFDEVAGAIAQFETRQRNLENSHRELQALLIQAQSKMEQVLQRPDLATHSIGILDIKNLGYELGRRMAERSFSVAPPVKADAAQLSSKLCTESDFATDWLRYWCHELRVSPYYHRKIWELCYVAQALFADGQLQPGRRGVVFGCGEEPLPSLFAKSGAKILATDLPSEHPEAEIWRLSAQHLSAIERIRRADICADPVLLDNIEFRPVDMTTIPREFDGSFDFCLSTCALEHLGTLAQGLDFIENSVRTLKPGGLAVHTTEFTVNEGPTIDNHPIVLYQRHHFEELAHRLRAKGHEVAEFDFAPGTGILDRFVDLPPFSNNSLIPPLHYAHLKLLFDGYTCTSMGIIIKAGAS